MENAKKHIYLYTEYMGSSEILVELSDDSSNIVKSLLKEYGTFDKIPDTEEVEGVYINRENKYSLRVKNLKGVMGHFVGGKKNLRY